MTTRARSLVGAALAVACALTARAQGPVPPSPIGAGRNAFAYTTPDGRIDTADVGTFEVPVHHATPLGPRMRLAYVRLRSRADRPGPPTVYLAGGPGFSGIDVANFQQLRFFEDLRQVGDVILLDQRGTGRSEPSLHCPGNWDFPANASLTGGDAVARVREQSAACAKTLRGRGIDLTAYNSLESADDVEALRRELQVRTVNLYGFSYGSHLAFQVARRHPSSVSRLVLGGIEGLGQTYKLPEHHWPVLLRLDSVARTDARLVRYVPSLVAAMRDVHARLARAPVDVAIPIRTVLRYAQRGWWKRRAIDLLALVRPRYHVRLSAEDLEAMLAVGFGRSDVLAELPSLYYRMSHGDYQRAALMSLVLRKGQEIGTAMAWVTDCQDGVSTARLDTIRRQRQRVELVRSINWPFPEMCGGWRPLRDIGDVAREPIATAIPVLIAAGTLDGRTPLEQVRDVVSRLPNARVIEVANVAHSDVSIFNHQQVRAEVLAFLRGEPPRLARVELPPFEWVPPVPIARSLEDSLFAVGLSGPAQAVVAEYWRLRRAHASDYEFDFRERSLNALGYRLSNAGRHEAAIAVLRLNVELFPNSGNVYDSLGEVYLTAGDSANAARWLREAMRRMHNPHSYRLLWRAEGRQP